MEFLWSIFTAYTHKNNIALLFCSKNCKINTSQMRDTADITIIYVNNLSFNPFTASHNICRLLLLSTYVAYIANDMVQDQTAQGSSLIRVHSVCLHDKILSEVTRIYAANIKGRQNFQDKNIGELRVKYYCPIKWVAKGYFLLSIIIISIKKYTKI